MQSWVGKFWLGSIVTGLDKLFNMKAPMYLKKCITIYVCYFKDSILFVLKKNGKEVHFNAKNVPAFIYKVGRAVKSHVEKFKSNI